MDTASDRHYAFNKNRKAVWLWGHIENNMLNSLTIRQIYAHQEIEVSIKDRKIYYRPSENKSAVTFWLE